MFNAKKEPEEDRRPMDAPTGDHLSTQQQAAPDKVPSSVNTQALSTASSHLDSKQPVKRESGSSATDDTVATFTNSLRSNDDDDTVGGHPSPVLMPEQIREPHVASGVQNLIAKEYPETDEDCNLVDNFLASKMNEMNLFEKEKGTIELHGFPSDQDPPPAQMEQCLRDLVTQISKIPNKKAYEEALRLNANYVTNRNFRLMFLRCDQFDTKAASQKMVWHFEVKRNIFGGGEILGRDVLLSDMSTDDMEAFNSGLIQVLKERDPTGRSVVVAFAKLRNDSTGQILKGQSFVRVWWYTMFHLSSQIENQKKGIVAIGYNVGVEKRLSFPLTNTLRKYKHGVPRKFTGVHICYDSWWLRPMVLAQKLYMLDSASRLRTKDHFGSHQECIFALSTFGILLNNPSRSPMIMPDGTISLKEHQRWLQERRDAEHAFVASPRSAMREEEEVIVPRRFDVLHGRGSRFSKHTGNMRLVHLCSMKLESYIAANKYQKTEIADRVVSIVHESFGRFLRYNNEEDSWEEVERENSREKVSHIFRHLRKKQGETAQPPQAETANKKRGAITSDEVLSDADIFKKSRT